MSRRARSLLEITLIDASSGGLHNLIMDIRVVWLLHFASVAFMTGLIWLVQVVHYPLMNRVDPAQFTSFHAVHSTRITFIVGPAMLVELATAIGLVVAASFGSFAKVLAWSCLALTAGVFASTAFLSVPQHAILGENFNQSAHARLVSTNWVRTILWSLHLVICLWGSIPRQGELS